MNSGVWSASSLPPTLGCIQAYVTTPPHLCPDHNATSHSEWQWQSSFTLYVPVTGTPGSHPFPLRLHSMCQAVLRGALPTSSRGFLRQLPKWVFPIDALYNLNQFDNTTLSQVDHKLCWWRWVGWNHSFHPAPLLSFLLGAVCAKQGLSQHWKTSHPRNAVI